MREPAIAWWPGTITAGRVETGVASTLDLFPTVLAMAEIELPQDRIIDGRNLLPLLTGATQTVSDDPFFYYNGARLFAVRQGPWKAHFMTQRAYVADLEFARHDPPLLFNLEIDPSEQYDVAADHPDIVAALRAAAAAHEAALEPYPDQLADRGARD